jgi:hypothetical protein
MKKIILMALISLSITVFAQDDNLPEKVENAFSVKYPNSYIDNWMSDEETYYLEFYVKGNLYTAVFTTDGVWKETSEIISDTEIPDRLKTFIDKNYPDLQIDYSEKVKKENSTSVIRVNLSNEQNMVVVQSDLIGNNIVEVK